MKKYFVLILIPTLIVAILSGCQQKRDEVYIPPPPYEGGDPGTDPGTDPEPGSDPYLVGCAYFAAWYEESGGWFSGGVNWSTLPQYAERIPTNGLYSSQAMMDMDIVTASSRGVDFWSILWYPHAERDPLVEKINQAVGWFMNSPNANKMKFMIEITNHTPHNVTTQSSWESIAEYVTTCMLHPSYLKIDGRPVVKIHGGDQLIADMGTASKCNDVIQAFRDKALAKGLDNPIVAVGLTSNNKVSGNSVMRNLNIDCSMQYNDVPSAVTYPYHPTTDHPYTVLMNDERTKRLNRATSDTVPYIPYSMSGWNGRAWNYTGWGAFSFPTREEWKTSLVNMKNDLDNPSYTNFGFPKRDGKRQKAFTIYAWNEFGEGGFIAPTAGFQGKYVEVIQEVFGNN